MSSHDSDFETLEALQSKVYSLQLRMQDLTLSILSTDFNTEELILLKRIYGENFIYKMDEDLDWLLRQPYSGETIH